MKHLSYWIAPGGADCSPGTRQAPLASAEEALARLRATEYDAAELIFAGGVHWISSPIRLTQADHDITFRCQEGERAMLWGGRPVTGWKQDSLNGISLWSAELGAEYGHFHALFSQEEILPPARWPKAGYFHVKDARNEDGYSGFGPDPNVKFHFAMYVNQEELPDFYNLTDVTLRILHYWKDETVNLREFDRDSGRVCFSKPATMTIKSGDRYYYENVREALSEPGQWYLDTPCKKLYYVPRPGEQPDCTLLYAGQAEQFLLCDGARNIQFRDLEFSMGDWHIPVKTVNPCGADHHQAALDVAAAFLFTNTHRVCFQGCRFSNILSTCLKFGENVQDISVTGNSFRDIGANVIQLFGENLSREDPRVTGGFCIRNNHIDGYGQRFFNGTAIGILHAARGVIANNEIHRGYSIAITVGWVWGYAHSVTSDVLVKQNLIYDVGQNVMSDMGAIYTLGVKEGVVITENVIHSVRANLEYGYGGWGIYMDEGSSNVMVTKNLVYDCNSTAFYQHYGRDNLIINNILAFSWAAQVSSYRQEPHTGFHLIRNIVVSQNQDFIRLRDLEQLHARSRMTEANNLYWDYEKGDRGIDCAYYTQILGLFHNARFEDPLFVDAKAGDFRLRPDSPAIALGFLPWDYTKAGLIRE